MDCNSTYRRLNNKLKKVINTASGSPVDMDYQYDALGNLAKDFDAEIDSIYWTLSGKVHYIKRENNSDKENLLFEYDPVGNRIAKHVFDSDSVFKHSTYYVRDAQGNILSTYHYKTGVSSSYMLKERNMYGSSRIGINTDSLEMIAVSPLYDQTVHTTSRGLKHYELTNHLGNVLAVVSDRKLPYPNGSVVDFYQPEIVSATDYYPGGMLMPGRNFNSNSYRYGYNKGSEKDDEITGVTGSHFTTFFREGDTRLLIWWSPDPKTNLQPHQSPYSYMNGNPILLNDPDGDCPPGTPCGDVVKNPTISSDNGGKNNNRFRMGNRTKGHEGVDILASKGTSLQNVIFGKVVYAKNNHASDEYSGSRRVDANGKKVSKAPTTGLGNSLVIEHTLTTDYTFQSAGKEVTLAKGMQVYIRYSHLDNVDESLLDKDVGVGVEIGKSGATGNPGLYQGKWGISAENRHVHIEASTSKDFSNSSRIDPEAFMNTKYDKQGNAVKTEDSPKK